MSSRAPGRMRRPAFTVSRRKGIAVVAAALSMAGGAAVVASAAVPTADVGNILVFPDRDFVSVEGYQQFAGQTATLTAKRGNTIIGQTDALIQEGDVAFEVNHPGGVCWGVGAPGSLKVTPDLQAGDVINISINGADEGDTRILDAQVDADPTIGPDGKTVTIKGHIGGEVNELQIEQRVVNPDLRPLVARRDVRAVPGPLTPAPKGGYSSGLLVAGGGGKRDVTATYVFDTAAAATAAANSSLGERLMAWEVQDAAANRQGMTISEFGELGGPGFGGCPAGPGAVQPQAGQYSVVRPSGSTSAVVNWSPATGTAGSATVTGYSVEAVGPASSGVSAVIGKRTGTGATRATIEGLDANATYTFEVRSITGTNKLSDPFPPATAANPGNPTPPTVTASPVGGDSAATAVEANSVTLTSAGNDIYYTTDTTSAIEGDVPSLNAKLYTGPIAITGDTELHWAAFNAAGLHDTGSGFYKKQVVPAPAAPTLGASTVSGKSITARWNAVSGATKYTATFLTSTGTQYAVVDSTTTSATINNVPAGTYTFTVTATTAGGTSAPSLKSGDLVVKAGDTLLISAATWKAGDMRVIGSSSSTTGTVTIYRANADGTPNKSVAALGSGAVTAAAAPATGGAFDIRLRNGATPATNPGRIVVESSNTGVSPVFTVTNK